MAGCMTSLLKLKQYNTNKNRLFSSVSLTMTVSVVIMVTLTATLDKMSDVARGNNC